MGSESYKKYSKVFPLGCSKNKNRWSLVTWKKVCLPKKEGGLGIKYPHDMNQSLGAKILWRLCTGEPAWWKSALHKNYMAGKRNKCIDNLNLSKVGSPVWELCKKTNSLIKDNMYWITGNGKKNRLWYDKLSQTRQQTIARSLVI